jgi:selenocysteine lyase/cysteine desulfurase
MKAIQLSRKRTTTAIAFYYRRRYETLLRRCKFSTGNGDNNGDDDDDDGGGIEEEKMDLDPWGYKSIGSFHSENLEYIMKQSDDEYTPPDLPFADANDSFPTPSENPREDFLLDFENWTFLNHGAFGAALKVGYDRSESWRRFLERQPLRYFDRHLLPHLAYSTRLLADFVNAPSKTNVTLIQNVTAGINSVMAGHRRTYGDSAHCMIWDTTYGSVKHMAHQYYNYPWGVSTVPLIKDYKTELANSEHPQNIILQAFDDHLNAMSQPLKDKNVLVVLDQTTSNTALNMPVEKLAARMKHFNPYDLVVVDGAHGLLAQNVNLTRMFQEGVDVYLSNGHKWLSASRGVGIMAIAEDTMQQHKETIFRHPVVISHGVEAPDLLSRFVWDGCRDYTAALAIPAVLDYWKKRNPKQVRKQCRNSLRQCIQILAETWHDQPESLFWSTEKIILADFYSSCLSPMALVKLPDPPGSLPQQLDSSDAKQAQDYLFQLGIEAPIKCLDGELYVRVSCHIYNEERDFEKLANALADYNSFL